MPRNQTGPCDCGALDCAHCGPLQGSVKCSVCRRYACDAHEGFDDLEERANEKLDKEERERLADLADAASY